MPELEINEEAKLANTRHAHTTSRHDRNFITHRARLPIVGQSSCPLEKQISLPECRRARGGEEGKEGGGKEEVRVGGRRRMGGEERKGGKVGEGGGGGLCMCVLCVVRCVRCCVLYVYVEGVLLRLLV